MVGGVYINVISIITQQRQNGNLVSLSTKINNKTQQQFLFTHFYFVDIIGCIHASKQFLPSYICCGVYFLCKVTLTAYWGKRSIEIINTYVQRVMLPWLILLLLFLSASIDASRMICYRCSLLKINTFMLLYGNFPS